MVGLGRGTGEKRGGDREPPGQSGDLQSPDLGSPAVPFCKIGSSLCQSFVWAESCFKVQFEVCGHNVHFLANGLFPVQFDSTLTLELLPT